MLPSVRPLMQRWSCGPVWEFADRNHITKQRARRHGGKSIWFFRPRLADCCAILSFDRLRPPTTSGPPRLTPWLRPELCNPLVSTSNAQTIRAVLLASATVTSMRGLRASMPSSHEPALARRVCSPASTTALLPMMSSRRSVRSPMLRRSRRASVSRPWISVCGVSPSQAAKSRPLAKVSAGGASAAIAVAPIGPMPGMVISRLRDTSSSRARRAISLSDAR